MKEGKTTGEASSPRERTTNSSNKKVPNFSQFWGHFSTFLDPNQNPTGVQTTKQFSVADPDPGSGAFFTPGSGIRDG
jgi:hypothetical protein